MVVMHESSNGGDWIRGTTAQKFDQGFLTNSRFHAKSAEIEE
jgi:hypothetical protein